MLQQYKEISKSKHAGQSFCKLVEEDFGDIFNVVFFIKIHVYDNMHFDIDIAHEIP